MVTSPTGDDESLTWSITAGNTDEDGDGQLPFAIGASTGAITVNDADDLDPRRPRVRSPSRPPTAPPPHRGHHDHHHRRRADCDGHRCQHRGVGLGQRAAVVTVSTTGDDESLTWSITNGNTDGDGDGDLPFAIGTSTGAITVNDADDLDFETTTGHDLTVQATDGTTADTEVITITITDVD